jgi:hypothetical protein
MMRLAIEWFKHHIGSIILALLAFFLLLAYMQLPHKIQLQIIQDMLNEQQTE